MRRVRGTLFLARRTGVLHAPEFFLPLPRMMASIRKTYAALRPDTLVMLWLGIWWCANLLEAGFTELANDEAYYHLFAERLAWGYFDHPPMTALLVWLGEHLFGGELGVRFSFGFNARYITLAQRILSS